MRFCASVNLCTDGDYCLASAPLEARNYVLACYAISLIQGNTILGGSVKHATLNGYIKAVVDMHTDRQLTSPRLVEKDLVSPLLDAVKRYESVPNRRDMIYDSMVSHMLQVTAGLQDDCLHSAILDWIILGRYGGFRQSEWCQTSQSIAMTRPSLALPVQEPLAFIPSDFAFFDSAGRPLPDIEDDSVDMVELTWRFQKNSNNGERIPFKRDYSSPDLCPVLAAVRIRRRAARLGIHSASTLAVYSDPKSVTGYSYITANQTAAFLRTTAQKVFMLDSNDDRLQRWSCHSLRVTAANLLHRARRSDSYIQIRLRWKSSTFLMYLRNTFYAADQHTAAMNISDRNLPLLSAPDGTAVPMLRDLEPHETFMAASAA